MNANAPEAHPEAVAAALRCMDEFLAVFNARDMEAVDTVFNYPSVRASQSGLEIIEAGYYTKEHLEGGPLEDWDHSEWTEREVVQASDDKVHVTTLFTRYRRDGSVLAAFNSLYVLTRQDGHWGVKMRSSFAP